MNMGLKGKCLAFVSMFERLKLVSSKPASADPCSEPRARASATLIPLSMRDPSYDLPPPYGAFYGPSGSWLERSIDVISPIGDDASRDREDREEDHSRDAGSQSSGAEWPWWKRMLNKREGSRTIRNCANGDGNITIMRLGSTDNLFVENVALGHNNHTTIEVGSSGRLFVKNVGIGSGNVNNIGNFSGTSRDPSSGMRFFSRR
jgi:hypothetical protein